MDFSSKTETDTVTGTVMDTEYETDTDADADTDMDMETDAWHRNACSSVEKESLKRLLAIKKVNFRDEVTVSL
jgi:hypothetical protein